MTKDTRPIRFRFRMSYRRLVCAAFGHRWPQTDGAAGEWCGFCGIHADGMGESLPIDTTWRDLGGSS